MWDSSKGREKKMGKKGEKIKGENGREGGREGEYLSPVNHISLEFFSDSSQPLLAPQELSSIPGIWEPFATAHPDPSLRVPRYNESSY